MYILLYNPKSKNKKSFKILARIISYFESEGIEYEHKNLLVITDYDEFFDSINPEHKIIIIGGDGTFSTFMNNISDLSILNNIYFYPAGTGNDFVKNLKSKYNIKMFKKIEDLRKVKADLPMLNVFGKDKHFINGVGIGFDGDVAIKVNASKLKNTFSYLTTSIKTILSFETFNIKVDIDGEEMVFEDVWLVAIQNGKYFGGGMKIAPKASLTDGKLDVCIVHSIKKLRFLSLLPSVFSGNHLKHDKYVFYKQGSTINVDLDRSKYGQIDGDIMEKTDSLSASIKKKFFDIF
jgi:YegS/Rv2252/BmrU family lipid kinase